jgi:hypothetical protein
VATGGWDNSGNLLSGLGKHRNLAGKLNFRSRNSGSRKADRVTFRERLLGKGAKLLLKEFLRMAAGCEDPVLVAQYHDAIEGYLFKDAA